MKKIAILTSILALTACGGGSAPIMPDAPVVPDTPSLAWQTVDADFGLGMVDINATRSANVDKAIKIAQLIEDENAGFEHDASIARNASARKMKSADLNITQEDIDKAYATMYDIFVNHNYKDYTNHDVLVSLALIYMDKTKILELLGNGNNGLDEKIAELIGGLKDNDDFFKDAQDIYQGFGKEFDLTLKNAHFYHNSNEDDYYTFVFDGDKLVALQAKDGDTYDKDKNGSFIKRVNGYEYTFDFQSDENDNQYFSGTVDKFYKVEPSDETIDVGISTKIIPNSDCKRDKPLEHLMAHHKGEPYMITAISEEPCTDHELFLKDISRVSLGRAQMFIKQMGEQGYLSPEQCTNLQAEFAAERERRIKSLRLATDMLGKPVQRGPYVSMDELKKAQAQLDYFGYPNLHE